MKNLQNKQNSVNLLLWPPICRNKLAITPKWFKSLDTNSNRQSITMSTPWFEKLPMALNFGLKMMVESGVEFFILKSYVPLQSCCCPVQNKSAQEAELAWQVSRNLWRGSVNFKIKKSRPLSTIIFKPKIFVSRFKNLSPLL